MDDYAAHEHIRVASVSSEATYRALLAVPHFGRLAVAVGAMQGPMHVSLFTLRQRRTDTQWLGRAVAISGSVNSLGSPIGSALAGFTISHSLEGAFLVGAAAGVAACVVALLMVPAEAQAG